MEYTVQEFFPVYLYFALVLLVTLVIVAAGTLFPAKKGGDAKYQSYESGIQRRTENPLMRRRFPLRHYLVALLFLVFDVEVVFLYPWAAICKEIGIFAFYEMLFFMICLLVGFAYIWRKGGLEWE